ncbi:MAG: presqualene diphosphate synthase HpnD [Ignavibacteriales bacterium]|nr:presqualene diphosphate synthase HpnD [Ignavibacteriales bacterium]
MSEQSAKEIAKKSKSSFYYAFSLMPKAKRNAMNIVYAFCRQTDDIVDEGSETVESKSHSLSVWRAEFEKAFTGQSSYSLLNKTASTIKQFNIPIDPFFELIKGMEMDLDNKPFETFEDLKLYCYRVASTVGLMCVEIFGYKHASAKQFAENLGIALQLTNIIRDVSKDAKNGRIYIPLEDLRRYNYSREELNEGIYNENFIALMEFQARRAQVYFQRATDSLNREDKPSMFAARAMQHIYYRLLKRIINAKYDIFNKQVNVSKFEKVGIAVGVWAKYNLVY